MNKFGPLLFIALFSGCGGSSEQMLMESPENICDLRFATEGPWCGGDPVGTWNYAGACHRPALQLLHELCPAGSFKMVPAKVTGQLILTSTSVKGNFVYREEARGAIELYEACIDELGTCPRSLEGAPLRCEGDSKTMCVCEIVGPSGFGSDQGAISIIESTVIYDAFEPPVESQFCIDSEYMFFEGFAGETRSDFGFFYILSRDSSK